MPSSLPSNPASGGKRYASNRDILVEHARRPADVRHPDGVMPLVPVASMIRRSAQL
jgi:hypothetical protein